VLSRLCCHTRGRDGGIREELAAAATESPEAAPGAALNPSSEGQKIAQRDIATALETALDARRQRII
jgi:hypothetical protein